MTRSLEDNVRLAAAWLKSGRPEVICVACGGLRGTDDPPCTCCVALIEVQNTWEAIGAALRPLASEYPQEVASSFYDVAWVPIDSAYQDYSAAYGKPGVFALAWRSAGQMVADLRGRGESYMDWCCGAESGIVSERVRAAMEPLGLRPVT